MDRTPPASIGSRVAHSSRIHLLNEPRASTHPSQVHSAAHTFRASKPFIGNTYEPPRMCCKQKTYSPAKPFRCNTYKKQGYPLQVKCSSLSSPSRLSLFCLPSSVRSSKFRIPQVLCLPLLRKCRGCGGTLPILEFARPLRATHPYFLISLPPYFHSSSQEAPIPA